MKKENNSRRQFIRQVSVAGMLLGLGKIPAAAFGPFLSITGKRIGIIGLDSSHGIEFTKILNDVNADPKYKGFKVTAAFPNGSEQIENGTQRIIDHTGEIKNYHVRIVNSIEELLDEVDAVMLETNDGRMHYEQALPVFKTGKPIFIDKPVAASLEDVKKIFALAEKYKTPLFSSSSFRYLDGMKTVEAGSIGKITGADVYSPAPIEKSHTDLFWYGIHGIEMLFTILGPGCKSVMRVHTADTDIVVGTWPGERLGVMRGIRAGKKDFGGTVYGENGITTLGTNSGYGGLVEKITGFFESGIPPVKHADTIEIYAFMDAAEKSKLSDGRSIAIPIQ